MYNPSLLDDVLKFVEISSLGMKKAADEVGVHQLQQKKASALRPQVLKSLVDNGLLTKDQIKAGEAMLGDHPGTMNMLKLAIDRIAAQAKVIKTGTAEPGRAEDDGQRSGRTKLASDSLTDPHVGRKTSDRKASDDAILAVLRAPGS